VYSAVAAAMSVDAEVLNMEGACTVDGALRWFHRGLPTAGLHSGGVDIDLTTALAAALGQIDPSAVAVTDARQYDLGAVDGVGLAVTDVVALPGGTFLAMRRLRTAPTHATTGRLSPRPWRGSRVKKSKRSFPYPYWRAASSR